MQLCKPSHILTLCVTLTSCWFVRIIPVRLAIENTLDSLPEKKKQETKNWKDGKEETQGGGGEGGKGDGDGDNGAWKRGSDEWRKEIFN